jgi:hypothetical protein
MPSVTVKTGITGADGREEELTEYICNWPGCPNFAQHVLGYVRETGLRLALCKEHVLASAASER